MAIVSKPSSNRASTMSSQKGNTKRTRQQKYKNNTAFKNNMHDKSRRTQQINTLEVAEVCKRCQEIIEWKIKYKKYKLLTQPKTCTRCHNKTIKDAYHIVCIPCGKKLEICCKCGKKEEIVQHKAPTELERMQTMAELEREVQALPERKRRSYYRYMEKLKGPKKKKPQQTEEQEEDDKESIDEEEEEEEVKEIPMEEYFRLCQKRLEELKAGLKDDDDFMDDFDDMGLSDDDDDDEDDDDEDEDDD